MASKKAVSEKVALVTGGSRGIGRGICLSLASRGTNIVVNYVQRAEAAQEVVNLCTEMGVDAISVKANVGVASDVYAMFQAVRDHFGRIDVLVNNAGVDTQARFEEMDESDWDYIFAVNVKGILFCAQEAVRIMKAQGRGVIVNITSILGQQVWTNASHYCAAKAAANMLTRCMAAELAPLGISVNAVAPGSVDTEMLRADLDPDELEAVLRRTPTRSIGMPEDIARVVAFLCEDASQFLTGEIILVDGGYTLVGDPIPP